MDPVSQIDNEYTKSNPPYVFNNEKIVVMRVQMREVRIGGALNDFRTTKLFPKTVKG